MWHHVVCLSVTCTMALGVGVDVLYHRVTRKDGTSYSFLQTLLLLSVSFRHNNAIRFIFHPRRTEPPTFPRLE